MITSATVVANCCVTDLSITEIIGESRLKSLCDRFRIFSWFFPQTLLWNRAICEVRSVHSIRSPPCRKNSINDKKIRNIPDIGRLNAALNKADVTNPTFNFNAVKSSEASSPMNEFAKPQNHGSAQHARFDSMNEFFQVGFGIPYRPLRVRICSAWATLTRVGLIKLNIVEDKKKQGSPICVLH